jgi:5-bromo-4-chloroindolyl phosphate hydrolysis protein
MSELEQVKERIAFYEELAESERNAIVKHELTLKSLHKYLKELEEAASKIKLQEVEF